MTLCHYDPHGSLQGVVSLRVCSKPDISLVTDFIFWVIKYRINLFLTLTFMVIEFSARMGENPVITPPTAVIWAAIKMLTSGEAYPHLAASIAVISAGFGLAVVTGFFAALVLHTLPSLARLVMPLADSARTVSALALMPALIVLVGIGFEAKALVIFWTAWPAVLINTMHGLASVDRDVQGAARVDGCSPVRLLGVLIPIAAPTILAGLRLAMGSAWVSLVAAEMLGSNSGLGFLVLVKSQAFDFSAMWAGVVFIALTGLGMNTVLNNISRRFDHEETARLADPRSLRLAIDSRHDSALR